MAGSCVTSAKPASSRNSPTGGRLSARAAFTLVELLIVIALLATVVSFGLPSLRKLSAKGELRTAARQLRVTLLETRLAAIDSGRPASFRYQAGAGQFEVERSARRVAPSDAASRRQDAAELDPFDSGVPAADEVTEPDSLPRGVRFADPASVGQPAPAAAASDVPEAGVWTEPMVFYPNGRTRNAKIVLINESYRIELSLRGLTGTVQISQVEQLPQLEAQTPEELPEVAL